MLDKAEKEAVTIRALCDVLSTVDVSELETNTLSCLLALVNEAGQKLYEYVKKMGSGSFKR